MKLKKAQDQETTAAMPAPGGAVIADRFKLDVDQNAGKSSAFATVCATLAVMCSLLSIVLLGVTAWMIYSSWDLIQNV